MIKLDFQDRKEFYEFKDIVEEIEYQAELHDESEDWSVEGRAEAPVSTDLARYLLEPQSYFMNLWNSVDEKMKNCERRSMRSEYRELERTLLENRSFLEEVYDLQKPLGRAKVEARYS